MTSRAAAPTILALAVLIVPAACGGDESSEGERAGGGAESTGGGALTVAEYQKRGNALCREAVRKVGRIPAPGSEEEIADYLESVFDVSEDVTDEFAELDPPSELRADHERAVELSEETDEKFDAVVDRIRESASPRAAITREFGKLAPDIRRGEELNERLGLDECNEVGPPAERPEAS